MSAAQLSKRVGDVFQVLGGGTPTTKKPAYWNGSIPWATSADLDNDLAVTPRKSISKEAIAASATNLVPAGSVIVATRVGLGKVGIAETKLCFSQDCQALIVDPRICDSKFVAHQLKLRVQIFKHISRGTTIAGVTKKQLLDVPFDLPPLPNQRRIVGEIEKQFSRLEEGVGALKRVQANLKRYRAAVLKAACEGQLVPGKAWPVRTVRDVTSIVTKGSSPNWQGFDYCEDGILFVRSQNIGWGKLDLSDVAHLPVGFNHKEKKSVLKARDVLLNIVGASIGRAAVATSEIQGGNVNQAVAVIRCKQETMLPEFLMVYLLSSATQALIHSQKVDVARANFSLEDIKQMPVPVPSLAEQTRIVAEVERRLSVVEELEAVVAANLQRAARLRQSILQKAFAGELA